MDRQYPGYSSRPAPILFDNYNSPNGGPPPPPPPPQAPTGSKRGRDGKEKESFKCAHPGCGQAYSRMEYLKRHQRKHEDIRPFACKDCDKSFARSDVLLRHHRRCHPTPPPESRSSRSPGPTQRAYPGVPVSSSRNDSRELSPPVRAGRGGDRGGGRGSDYDHHASGHTRTRTGSEEEEEDAFALAQQVRASSSRGERDASRGYTHLDPEPVYDVGTDYYNIGDSSTYTPHLLPMFQPQPPNQQYHPPRRNTSQDDSNTNHLEDASVLLSMAYPGGVPGDGSRRSGSSSRSRVPSGPDWNGQNINMILNEDEDRRDAALGESVGSIFDSMGWLNGSSDRRDATNGNQGTWPPHAFNHTLNDHAIDPSLTGAAPPPTQIHRFLAPEPTLPDALAISKPFSPSDSLSGLFSPSLFGPPAVPALTASQDSSPDDDIDLEPDYEAVRSLLDQLAKYDAPQTHFQPQPPAITPYAERPLITIEHNRMLDKAGKMPLDPSNPFYLDPNRFVNCYEITHWRMPPMRVLSTMAAKTYHTVLNHFSFIHQPTFRLHDTAACLAFAICTVGGIRSSYSDNGDSWTRAMNMKRQMSALAAGVKMDGPVVPEASWESLYAKNYQRSPSANYLQSTSPTSSSSAEAEKEMEAEKRIVEEWDAGDLVRNDKTNMLVKSFSQATGVLMTEYNCGLLQALILYHAPYYLSENEQERSMANMFMGTIVNITRQIGFLNTELEHFSTTISLPREPSTPNDVNMAWRRWIQLETRRRTAYLVYHLDTVSALESNIPYILSSCEYSNLPLPAPDALWKAPTAQAWAEAARGYRSMTLDEAMRRVFFLPGYGAFDMQHAAADTKYYNLLNEQTFGPFARVAMVLTLLRGVMDIGEGKRDRGDWRDLTDLWVTCAWLKPGKKIVDGDGKEIGEVTRESLRGRFTLALERGWDFDPLCTNHTTQGGNPMAGGMGAPQTLMYCEEALPFYWLAQALLSILNSLPPHDAGHNAFRGLKYGDMLKSARTFTRLGEGAGATSALASANPSVAAPDVPPTANTFASQGGNGLPSGDTGIGLGNLNGGADIIGMNAAQGALSGTGMMDSLEGLNGGMLGGFNTSGWA